MGSRVSSFPVVAETVSEGECTSTHQPYSSVKDTVSATVFKCRGSVVKCLTATMEIAGSNPTWFIGLDSSLYNEHTLPVFVEGS